MFPGKNENWRSFKQMYSIRLGLNELLCWQLYIEYVAFVLGNCDWSKHGIARHYLQNDINTLDCVSNGRTHHVAYHLMTINFGRNNPFCKRFGLVDNFLASHTILEPEKGLCLGLGCEELIIQGIQVI